MSWIVIYHCDVDDDLKRIGSSAARRIMRAIDGKLTQAPRQFGAPLVGDLSGFRKLRVGDYRVVYQVVEATVTVYVLAVGSRRNKEIYHAASVRL